MRGSVQRIPLTDLEVPLVPGTPGKPSTGRDARPCAAARRDGWATGHPPFLRRHCDRRTCSWLATVFTEPDALRPRSRTHRLRRRQSPLARTDAGQVLYRRSMSTFVSSERSWRYLGGP